jgi:hypothetical protein
VWGHTAYSGGWIFLRTESLVTVYVPFFADLAVKAHNLTLASESGRRVDIVGMFREID